MSEWVLGMCNEKSGFLFSHLCDRPPLQDCVGCHKPICADHAHEVSGQVLCTSCKKKSYQESGQMTRRGGGRGSFYDDDPYFYGYSVYNGYGHYGHRHRSGHAHDPHDFTEADAESLAHPGDENFESDMTES